MAAATADKPTKSHLVWLFVALGFALFAAPHATAVRVAVDTADPFYWALVRFAPVALVMTPFVWRARKDLLKRKAWLYGGLASICMSAAILFYTLAIYYSQASYVAIITLVTPIILVTLSWILLKIKINQRAAAGVTLAALGAMVLVVLPIAVSGGSVAFYPLATILGLANSVMFSLAIIFMRRVHEHNKIPLLTLLGLNALVATIIYAFIFYLFGDFNRMPNDMNFWLLVLYSGFGIALFGRMIMIKVFEKVGSAFNAGMSYLETFLAILIPVFLIGEKISITMTAGGILILIGLYLIEHQKSTHAKHHHTWRHH